MLGVVTIATWQSILTKIKYSNITPKNRATNFYPSHILEIILRYIHSIANSHGRLDYLVRIAVLGLTVKQRWIFASCKNIYTYILCPYMYFPAGIFLNLWPLNLVDILLVQIWNTIKMSSMQPIWLQHPSPRYETTFVSYTVLYSKSWETLSVCCCLVPVV